MQQTGCCLNFELVKKLHIIQINNEQNCIVGNRFYLNNAQMEIVCSGEYG